MKKILFFLILAVGCISSHAQNVGIAKAINTVNSVSLQELNLRHGTDYMILNTVSAEAVVSYQVNGKKIIVSETNGEFILTFEYSKDGHCEISCDGVARFGFLSNDHTSAKLYDSPEYVARNLAIYRLINAVKISNADGIIEPLVSSNVERRGKDLVIKTTATGKLIKLITDK